MTRREKRVKIEGKEIAVKELTVMDIQGLFEQGTDQGIDVISDAVIGRPQGTKKLLSLCTPFSESEIEQMGVNSYMKLVHAMKEMNADFFAISRQDLVSMGMLVSESRPPSTPDRSAGSSGKDTKTP